jgi:ADP-heptose:LPS heptosyltransferase|uniref:Uncharacterized protein n=1 Tax=Desulfobacca acetoxidans TaxID=60893 RepID=A0A7V6A163_9BACT
MSKIIPFDQLARAQHLNFLEHKRRDYREREDYLARLRRLLFQIEGQMRQTEVQQLEVFLQAARHFQVNLELPIQGDRLAVQRAFTDNLFLAGLSEFFAGRLSAEEFLEKIDLIKEQQAKK